MAENDQDVPAAPRKNRRNLKMFMVGVIAVLLVVGLSAGATLYFLRGRYADTNTSSVQVEHGTQPKKAGQAIQSAPRSTKGKPLYTEVKQPFIVTLNASGATHYFQVFVAFMARNKGALNGLESRMPEVRNQLRVLFASQDFMKLQTLHGKKALQKTALDEVNGLLKGEKLAPINRVLFTNFVLQ